MRSTEKMKKLLGKTCDYQAKVNDNLGKFNSLLEKYFSVLIDSSNAQRIFLTYLAGDGFHINYDGIGIIDSKDFINCLEEKIKIFGEKYQCKDWKEFQEDFIDKCSGY